MRLHGGAAPLLTAVGGARTDPADTKYPAPCSHRLPCLSARSRLDVDVALGEILHFLTNDERLPGRTRKAVQFLHGLREQMVQHDTQKSNPELFDCPFSAASVEQYTFKEVRTCYGDDFGAKFWPVFQVRSQPVGRA